MKPVTPQAFEFISVKFVVCATIAHRFDTRILSKTQYRIEEGVVLFTIERRIMTSDLCV